MRSAQADTIPGQTATRKVRESLGSMIYQFYAEALEEYQAAALCYRNLRQTGPTLPVYALTSSGQARFLRFLRSIGLTKTIEVMYHPVL